MKLYELELYKPKLFRVRLFRGPLVLISKIVFTNEKISRPDFINEVRGNMKAPSAP